MSPAGKEVNSSSNSVLKISSLISIALLGVLLVGSAVFYKEKLLFSDLAYTLFRIINDHAPFISASRYGTAVTQMLPLLAVQMHMSLQMVMILYSIATILVYIIVSVLLVAKFRRYGWVILLGFNVTLFADASFYYWSNESMPLLFLAFAVSFYFEEEQVRLLLALPLFIILFSLAISTHPLTIPVAVYLWFFFMCDKDTWPYTRTRTLLYTVLLLLITFIKYHYGKNHGYDSGPIEKVTQFDLHRIMVIYTAPQFRFFMHSCLTDYWLLVILYFAGLIGLLAQRRYFQTLLTIFFSLAYVMLLCITYWEQDSLRFYMEFEYMPLSVICTAPFVCYVLPKFSFRVATVSLIFIFCVRLIYIYNARTPFEYRMALLEKVEAKMKEKGVRKLVITDIDKHLDSTLMHSWAAPVESIMLSELKCEQPQRTFIFATSDEAKVYLKTGMDTLVGCWEKRGPAQLNGYYFHIDTTTRYQVTGFSDLMK